MLYKSVILFYHDQYRPVCGDLDSVANMATSKHESKYELENHVEKNCDVFFVASVMTCSICFDFQKEDQEVALKKMPSKFSRSVCET